MFFGKLILSVLLLYTHEIHRSALSGCLLQGLVKMLFYKSEFPDSILYVVLGL